MNDSWDDSSILLFLPSYNDTSLLLDDNSSGCSNSTRCPGCVEGLIIGESLVENFVSTMDLMLLFCCGFSSVLQLYVLRRAWHHIRRGASDQCLHVFLFSMTIGDFLLVSMCYPLELLPRVQWVMDLPRAVNICVHFFTWLGLSGSSLSLVLLNLDKLLYFKCPLRYSTYVTRRKGISIAVSVWSGCILFVSSAWYFECFRCVDENCSFLALLRGQTLMYVFFTISVCIVPALTSLAVALYILKVVSTHRRRLAEEQALYSNGVTQSHAVSSRMRTFYFIFMTTIFTVATLIPYRVISVQRTFTDNSGLMSCMGMFFLWLMNYLVTLNAILNPLITVTVLPQYRCSLVRRFLGRPPSADGKITLATEL